MFGFYSRIACSERGGYRLARMIRKFRNPQRWQDHFTTPHGFEMDLNLGVYPDICMAYGLYELSTVRLIRHLLKPGDHFVDAGANIGYLTLHAAQVVGTNGRVDAIEPEPGNFERLKNHLAQNGLEQQVNLHAGALSDHQGKVSLYHWPENDPEHNHGCSSLYTDHSESAQCVHVECQTLDAILDGKIPRLIKMDVEGAEPMLVEGMFQTLLAPNPPIIIGEFNPTQARIAGFAPHEWIARIRDIQPTYKVYTIGSRLRRRKPDTLGGLKQMNLLLKV